MLFSFIRQKLRHYLSEKCKVLNRQSLVKIKILVYAAESSTACECKGICIKFCRHSCNPFSFYISTQVWIFSKFIFLWLLGSYIGE